MVLKPATVTRLSALLFAEICAEAGLPPGVFNVITGQFLRQKPLDTKICLCFKLWHLFLTRFDYDEFWMLNNEFCVIFTLICFIFVFICLSWEKNLIGVGVLLKQWKKKSQFWAVKNLKK